ncbi:threonine-phosphate decarboxylase [Phocaeicola sp.]|uniref:threonine-phosphate decarboxylase n=1 Tax=Phocaeicola sp. TaxID=2773926 RepID=UPI0023C794A3|nr:threonine-phosphate decarboxylase [Phocaeicola sp.]MDE5676612.1 pyridoxal phosphate-dependent class II aminotransferase [Phocaeicola sp.]
MIEGHGDDAYKYKAITINFSSNVYNRVDHSGLHRYLFRQMESIRTYPEPEPCSLEKELAEQLRLLPRQVCVTNGATEAIYLIAQTFRNRTSAVLMPTFSEYADACCLHGHKVISLYSLCHLPEEAGLVWLCNPNNPTGEVRNKEELLACINANLQRIFVIDQSYEFFTQRPLLGAAEAAALPNVILLHSMTKRFAVPGLRIGYATGCERLLREIRLQRMPWSVNQLAIEAGHYLLRSSSDYNVDISLLLNEKERLAQALLSIGGMEVWPSDTHYMLIRLRMGKASALKEYLATEHGILIRDASNFEGLDEHFFRIATQTPEENDKLIKCIAKWIYML